MEFERFLLGVVHALLFNDQFYGVLLEAKIMPDLWPDGKARSIAQRYLEIRSRESHGAATALLYREALEVSEHPEVAFDADALRVVFFKKRKSFLIDRLIEKLKTQPEKASDHIRSFEEGQKTGSDMVHLGSDVDRAFKDLVRRSHEGITLRPIEGYPLLTQLVSGFNPERFALFIARSGFGKTTAMVNLGLAACRSMSVLYINMEMSQQDFVERAICAEGGIDYAHLLENPERFQEAIDEIQARLISKDFHFSTGRSMSLGEIKAECVLRKKRTGLDFVIIDYDQKIDLDGSEDEWRQVQKATKFFEDLAKELQCYIMLLAQEGDSGDISSSKRAKFVATTVFRFYQDEDSDVPLYLIEAIKNRYGKRGKIQMDYDPRRLRLREVQFYDEQRFEKSVSSVREQLRKNSPRAYYNPSADR